MRITKLLAPLVLAIATAPALAWDGTQTVVPGTIDVTDGSNMGFRVWGPTCNGASNFAYLLSTDSNYNAYVATILMAKSQGLSVTFYTTKDANNYCHLGYITLH